MRERVLAIVTLIAQYFLEDQEPKSESDLVEELLAVGFAAEEIDAAFIWMENQTLQTAAESQELVAPVITHRVFSAEEQRHLTREARGFLVRLRGAGILDEELFEEIVHKSVQMTDEKSPSGRSRSSRCWPCLPAASTSGDRSSTACSKTTGRGCSTRHPGCGLPAAFFISGKNSMAQSLVIVESPAKAKTIEKFLGPGYKVLASYGHVRALPSKQGSVDVANDFDAEVRGAAESKHHIEAISKALKESDRLLLATDPDREGEAISWHLLAALGLDDGKATGCRSSGSSSTRSPRGRSCRPSPTPATSPRNWSMPSRPARSSTIWSASTSPRFCGKRSATGFPPAACSRWPCA